MLRERRDALAAALGGELRPRRSRSPAGGMNLWVPLDAAPTIASSRCAPRAADVIVSPGRPFFPPSRPGPFLRLTYAAEPPERLAEAVRRLTAVLKR